MKSTKKPETETEGDQSKTASQAAGTSSASESKKNEEPQNNTEIPLEKPRRSCFHQFFVVVSILTVLVALWMAAGQIVGMVYYKNSPTGYVLRTYVILLCVFVVFLELEWPSTVRESILLHNWITKGLFYTFIGVIGLAENETSEPDNDEFENYDLLSSVLEAVAWSIIGFGCLYFVMGLLCLQLALSRMRQSYQEKRELYKNRGRTSRSLAPQEQEEDQSAKDAEKSDDAKGEENESSDDANSDVEAQEEKGAENEPVSSGYLSWFWRT